jgi:lysine biosynthesis protein LysW
MSKKGDIQMAQCPECENPIQLSKNVKLGTLTTCPECDCLLEVISLNPLDLDYAFGDEEWEDDYEDDEEV